MTANDIETGIVELPGGTRIMVVDDNAANVELLQRMLSSAGVSAVDGFTDPRAALAASLAAAPDALLLDLHMPGLEGVEFLHRIRTLLGNDRYLPVIVLTADATRAAKTAALAAGATDFLTKPFDRAEVLLRVRNLLEMGRLHQQVRHHNQILQAEVDRQRAEQQRLATEWNAAHDRIIRILNGSTSLHMVFQPIVDLTTDDLVGVEALARFNPPPDRSPDGWFAEAGQVGLGTALELHAIDRALEALRALPSHAFISVNASAVTATSIGLRERLTGLPHERVVVELTEHERVEDYERLRPAFDELRAQGVRLAVDDAGAGFAGLQHILRIRPDIVKLDNDLTRDLHRDPSRRALVTALLGFAGELGADLLAEGIENEEVLDTLRTLGVRWGQGYFIARPAPLASVA